MSTREHREEERKSRETKLLDQKSRAISHLEKRVTQGSNPSRHRRAWCELDSVAETSQLADHVASPRLRGLLSAGPGQLKIGPNSNRRCIAAGATFSAGIARDALLDGFARRPRGHGVGRSTSTGLVATIAFNVAVTIARPSPLAVTTPKGVTVTTVTLDDDQLTVAVASSTRRSESVTSALSCDASPLRLKLALPSIEREMAVGRGVGLTEDLSPHATAEMATRTRRP